MEWDGATALVTGASRGIGRAVAMEAARRGARVGLIARSGPDLDDVLRSLPGKGAKAVADIGDRAQLTAAVEHLEAELGPTDILVANAGIGAYGPFSEIGIDEVERLVQVNLLGTIYQVKAVIGGMIERRRGHLVIVSSVAGRFGSPFEAAYASTKFAQIGLAEALSVELSTAGVGVSIINPGVVDTDFFRARGHTYDRAFPKPVAPESVARAVIRAVEGGRLETFVPRYFRPFVVVRHLAPRMYEWGTRRSFRDELSRQG